MIGCSSVDAQEAYRLPASQGSLVDEQALLAQIRHRHPVPTISWPTSDATVVRNTNNCLAQWRQWTVLKANPLSDKERGCRDATT